MGCLNVGFLMVPSFMGDSLMWDSSMWDSFVVSQGLPALATRGRTSQPAMHRAPSSFLPIRAAVGLGYIRAGSCVIPSCGIAHVGFLNVGFLMVPSSMWDSLMWDYFVWDSFVVSHDLPAPATSGRTRQPAMHRAPSSFLPIGAAFGLGYIRAGSCVIPSCGTASCGLS